MSIERLGTQEAAIGTLKKIQQNGNKIIKLKIYKQKDCHGITLKEKLSRERFKIRLFKAMLNVLCRTKFPRIVTSEVRQCETLQISKVRKPANFTRSQFATG